MSMNELQDQINALQRELEKDPSRAPEIWAKQQRLQTQQALVAQGLASGSNDASKNTQNSSPNFPVANESTKPRSTASDGGAAARAPGTSASPSDSGASDASKTTSTSSTTPSVASANAASASTGRSTALTLSNPVPPIGQFASEINAAAAATGVPADLIGAVIYKESGGNPALVSGKPTAAHRSAGIALGLMQVEPNTSPEIEAAHPELSGLDGAAYDIMLGSWRLADLARQFQGWDTVLRAYNSGAWAPVLKDPSAAITTGDPKYVWLVNSWWEALSRGWKLPESMNPGDVRRQ